jgi:hypothetical protein
VSELAQLREKMRQVESRLTSLLLTRETAKSDEEYEAASEEYNAHLRYAKRLQNQIDRLTH